MIRDNILTKLKERIKEPRRFLQVLAGPRQVGKTTLAIQLIEAAGMPSHYASADAPALADRAWIEAQWEAGRRAARSFPGGALLVLDEIQKAPDWSGAVKALWDEDSASGIPLRVLLLGSSPLLMGQGLTESLAGRFETVRAGHWSYPEMREAFGWDLDRFIFFGGYPGAAPLAGDEARWARYVSESIVETTLSKDILLMRRVDKPALLRRLFLLGCAHSAQPLSFQKMLGQLQERGNTTTLAHYLQLLESAGFLAGLPKHSGRETRRRASSPKLLALDGALAGVACGLPFAEARGDPALWGRLVETAVGAHLYEAAQGTRIRVGYWREGNREVDYVLSDGRRTVMIEVKSGRPPRSLPGMEAFRKAFPGSRPLLVGKGGIPLEEFLSSEPGRWLAE